MNVDDALISYNLCSFKFPLKQRRDQFSHAQVKSVVYVGRHMDTGALI